MFPGRFRQGRPTLYVKARDFTPKGGGVTSYVLGRISFGMEMRGDIVGSATAIVVKGLA